MRKAWPRAHRPESSFTVISIAGAGFGLHPSYVRVECLDCGAKSAAMRFDDAESHTDFKSEHWKSCPVTHPEVTVNCVRCKKRIPQHEGFAVHGNEDAYHCKECSEKYGCRDC